MARHNLCDKSMQAFTPLRIFTPLFIMRGLIQKCYIACVLACMMPLYIQASSISIAFNPPYALDNSPSSMHDISPSKSAHNIKPSLRAQSPLDNTPYALSQEPITLENPHPSAQALELDTSIQALLANLHPSAHDIRPSLRAQDHTIKENAPSSAKALEPSKSAQNLKPSLRAHDFLENVPSSIQALPTQALPPSIIASHASHPKAPPSSSLAASSRAIPPSSSPAINPSSSTATLSPSSSPTLPPTAPSLETLDPILSLATPSLDILSPIISLAPTPTNQSLKASNALHASTPIPPQGVKSPSPPQAIKSPSTSHTSNPSHSPNLPTLSHMAPPPISLEQAIIKALSHAASIRQEQHRLSSASYERKSLYALFLPSLSSSYAIAPNVSDMRLQLSMNVFRGFADMLALDESAQNIARRKLALDSATSHIILNTKLAYINVLQSNALLHTAQESTRLLNEQLRKASSLYKQGLRAKNEVLTIKLQLANATISLASSQQNLTYALAELGSLLGEEIAPKQIQDIHSITVRSYDKAILLHSALNANEAYLSLRHQLDSARIALASTRAQFLPQVDITTSARWLTGQPSYYDIAQQSNIRLLITWSLFQGLRDSFTYQARHQDIQAISQQITQYERDISVQIDALLRDYERAKAQLHIAQDALKQAKENYTITNNRYLQNLSTYTELINAELLLTSMQTSINQARYMLAAIEARIEQLTHIDAKDSAIAISAKY